MFNPVPKHSQLLLSLFLLCPLSPSLAHADAKVAPRRQSLRHVCRMSQQQVQVEVRYVNACEQFIPIFNNAFAAIDVDNIHDLQTLLTNTQQARASLLPAYQTYKGVRVPTRFKKGDSMLRRAADQMFTTLDTIETGLTNNNMNQAERGITDAGRVMVRLGYARVEIGQRMMDFSRELEGKKKAPTKKARTRRSKN